MRVGILTVSDKGSRGEREDTSGAAIRELIAAVAGRVTRYAVVPDEFDLIVERLRSWADAEDGEEVDVILTTGGTGLAPRDVTPEATRAVIEREVPGLAELMRAEGLKNTRRAALSRAVAGTRGAKLILNLPGSPRGARESLDAVADLLPHVLELLRGNSPH